MATGVEATPDSVFQIGSTTKLWTASLVMQLVDEGLLDLDQPVRRYLPEFRIADEAAAASITARQLLSHTAGFEGDIFTDTGKGDDCLEKFVLTLGDTPQLFPPGERFSYNNAGYCVLGRLVEVLREKPFDDCLRDGLFVPLGLTHAATGPYEAILFRAAVGHVRPAPDAPPQPAPVWALARSNAPAGSMLAMRPRDLLAFAQMHMSGGRAADGTVVLSAGRGHADARAVRRAAQARAHGRRVGAGTGAVPDIPGPADRPRRQHHRAGVVPALPPRQGRGGGPADQRRRHRSRSTGTSSATSSRSWQAWSCRRSRPRRPHPSASTRAATWAPTPRTCVDMVVSQADDGRIWLDQIPKGIFAEMGEKPERIELVHYADDSLIPLQPDRGMYHAPRLRRG